MPAKATRLASFAQDANRAQSRAENIATFAKLLSRLQQLQPALTLDQLTLLLIIGARPGITTNALMATSGVGQSSISRNIAALSSHHRRGYLGHDFVEAAADLREPRRYTYRLNDRGHRFLSSLLAILGRDKLEAEHMYLDDCTCFEDEYLDQPMSSCGIQNF
jgi:DNA-binding MarR family transcriptional regulator